MNIIVATPFDSANFGAFLQAYCLKIYLENQGHAVKHIRTRDEEYVKGLYYHVSPKGRREKIFRSVFDKQKDFGEKKYKRFREAHKCFDVVDSFDGADLVIVGSDEIWNAKKPVFQKSVFWGVENIPSISYATSIGDASMDDFDGCPDLLQQLRHMKSVLVRDQRTFAFAEQYADVKPKIVCDPTILLPVSDYGNPVTDEFIRNNRCLLVYAYKLDGKIIKVIQEYARKQKLKTVSCCFNQEWCDYQCDCGPLEFSSLIRQCEQVVTTTFHGSIFSMLNHASFVCIPKSVKSNQILVQFGLQDRIVRAQELNNSSLESVFEKGINYEAVEERIVEWRKKSEQVLNRAIENIVNYKIEYSETICFSNKCTGCLACAQICPKKAITAEIDSQGRVLPAIDMEKCVKCGACKRICPQHDFKILNLPRNCFAAQRSNPETRKGSSSGGIGAALAENFIIRGYAACGAIVNKGKVEHRLITERKEADLLRGSKYVQSRLSTCFEDMEKHLKEKKKVLFFGTPCQVAAVRKLFGKYAGLYCVDIVCHGVPPMDYLEKYLKTVVPDKEIDDFTFRGEPVDFVLKLSSNGEVVYQNDKFHDEYYHAFLKCLTYRENCFNCRYAQVNRCGDLTIGDFWKLNKKTLKKNFDGKISLVLENTPKGHELLELIQEELIIEKREISEAVNGNPQLYRPSLKHKNRNKFIRSYLNNQNFVAALASSDLKKEMNMLRLKRRIYRLVSLIIKTREK